MNEGLVVFVRSIIGFFSLLIFTKLLGKQQISQLTFFDYVNGITIGSIAGTLTTDLSSMAWPHFVGLVTWTALVFIVDFITLKFRYMSKYIEGEPTVVIMKGKIMDDALRKMKYRISDLLLLLRTKDIFDLTQVDFAIIEPNGQLSVLLKPEYSNVTAKDLKIKKEYEGISTELIYDGVIVDQNLRQMNKSKKWLMKELKKKGIKDESEVFLALLNPAGTLYIDTYDDHLKKVLDMGDFKGPY